jgi:hypothetical protein
MRTAGQSRHAGTLPEMGSTESERRILVTFRDTPDPPTVIISTDSSEALFDFKQALVELATPQPPARMSAGELQGVMLEGLAELTMVRVADAKRLWPVVETHHGENGPVVTFYGRQEDWLTRVA